MEGQEKDRGRKEERIKPKKERNTWTAVHRTRGLATQKSGRRYLTLLNKNAKWNKFHILLWV